MEGSDHLPLVRRKRRAAQLAPGPRTWGGARKGAGRKPKGARAGVSHLRRPRFAARFPVLVTLRMLPHVWSLRSGRSFAVIGRAILALPERLGLRVCEFSVQSHHMNLIVEAADQGALALGMRGLGVRLARGLNAMMERKGTVFADRYHAHILRTLAEVRHAVQSVRHNRRGHAPEHGRPLLEGFVDAFSSVSSGHGLTLPAPRTRLLGRAARAAGPAAPG